jgi:hypothetical protein
LQRELDVLAKSVVQIKRGQIVSCFVRPMFKGDRNVVFPMARSGRTRIISDHRRAALRQKQSLERNEQRRKYSSR